jgi:hypothetical protein
VGWHDQCYLAIQVIWSRVPELRALGVMRKFILGVFVGVAISVVVFVPLLLSERRDKFEFGRKNGIVAGRFESVDALEKEFGRYDGHTPYKVLFSVKTTDVISMETNGIRTVRVIP